MAANVDDRVNKSSRVFVEVNGDTRAPLEIHKGDLTVTARALRDILATRSRFLDNGRIPVSICKETTTGMPVAVEIDVYKIINEAHRICRPIKSTDGRLRPKSAADVTLPERVARLYLAMSGEWGLPPFRGITCTPILTADGGIRITQGYDPQTGMWCHNIPSVSVPDKPSQRDAAKALHQLRMPFRTFPFADAERIIEDGVSVVDLTQPAGLDESSYLVGLLTAVCHPSLHLTPGLLLRAPDLSGSGTGKGALARSAAILNSGVSPSAFTTGHDAEELDKRIATALIRGRPALFLDNVNRTELCSDALASALTERPISLRILGQSHDANIQSAPFIAVTGNGVHVTEDLARRFIDVTLDARVEDPESRKFPIGIKQFLDNIHAQRGELLAAILTIWRYGRQNALRPGKPLGSYEDWCRWCRDPLLALGCRDPVERIVEIKRSDPLRSKIVETFEAWWKYHNDLETPGADLALAVKLMISPDERGRDHRIRKWLSQTIGTRAGGFVLKREDRGPQSRPTAYYHLEKTEAGA